MCIIRESNPEPQLGRLICYHYTNDAWWSGWPCASIVRASSIQTTKFWLKSCTEPEVLAGRTNGWKWLYCRKPTRICFCRKAWFKAYQCDIRSKVEQHTKKKAGTVHPCTTHVRTCLYRLQDTWLSAIATFKRNSIILIIPIATDQCFPRSRNFSEYLKYVGRAYKKNNNNKRQYECMFFGRTVLYCFNSLHIWLIDCTHKSDKNKHCYSSNLVLEFSSTWHTPWIEGKSQNTWQYTVALKVTIKVCQNIKFVPFMGTW